MAEPFVSGGFKNWIEQLQSIGRRAFSLRQAHDTFPDLSEDAFKLALNRIPKKDKVISIHNASQGILPPALCLNGLTQFLERPYYAGLLSDAA